MIFFFFFGKSVTNILMKKEFLRNFLAQFLFNITRRLSIKDVMNSNYNLKENPEGLNNCSDFIKNNKSL